MIIHTDVLVIGSGIAGLFYTLRVADQRSVILVTKKQTMESNTNYAQGGIASVFSRADDRQFHIRDTMIAGAGLCHEDAVRVVVTEGPDLVGELVELGVRFTMRDGTFDLGREGGHSHNRIVHAKDLTGAEIERALVARVMQHPNVTVLENHVAIDLITEHNLQRPTPIHRDGIHCWGAYVLDNEQGVVKTYLASTTVLSTGGCGQVYLHTTNPGIATGDGIAMAYRAGADIANMEFIQFHPTSLAHPDAHSFLISEAVRGHGAVLRNGRGERFMARYDERQELAPRDIVARAIDNELKKSGDDCVYLDLRHLDADDIRQTFPNIHARCLALNIDITRDLVPVVPAAHYVCGGVVSDLQARSTIAGLLVCGEVSMTGLHGANRLASNSLLEALVFAERAAATTLAERCPLPSRDDILAWDDSGTDNMEEWVLISHNRDEVRRLMWDFVGIMRSTLRLERAQRRIELLLSEVEDFYKRTKVSEHLVELRNIALVASLIIESALRRKESRGLHYTTDYPDADPSFAKLDTYLSIFGRSIL
jgi:L-aspartate oxidase